ncbi:MAG: hypothetical protein COW79_04475 [Bdellovibrionales bacterium CG22_combo_CG10-13_8_21_14_all_38_13]|nr:MAG: hypothetical protein COW79_04475 [Bdellovibrionales bacterium CG22_combo_CG10-13_8_21_14_all_38_13]
MKHYSISDELWTRLAHFLPNYQLSTKGGRPRLNLKKVFEGILYVKSNRVTWREIPEEYGSKTAINDYYSEWKKTGVFKTWKQEQLLVTPELMAVDLA